ncbi:DUF6193 family natural product biosynthesis protein [Actinomadura violacea]|uniref:Knr4/Smi1-like domain-containing protein n=1 Tax=Actinomadura violacea TaxID=2819934 RepID=A0ABS3RLB8_9ACTN|nr:DUF6193 family natural product biosynthesis protein [Actinomadura violacea]MBO2457531.1 hypothetical protein [Actinomadura violacea]
MSHEPDPAVLYPDVAAHGSLAAALQAAAVGRCPSLAEGATLDEIGRAAPFDLLTGRFEVPDRNPADVVASEWRWLLKDAGAAGWPQYQALIESAHAEPRLRRLYPFTSHWALSFSDMPDSLLTPTFVAIDSPQGTGDYAIREWWNGPVLAQVATPAEAIAFAVDRIPADLLRISSDAPAQGGSR